MDDYTSNPPYPTETSGNIPLEPASSLGMPQPEPQPSYPIVQQPFPDNPDPAGPASLALPPSEPPKYETLDSKSGLDQGFNPVTNQPPPAYYPGYPSNQPVPGPYPVGQNYYTNLQPGMTTAAPGVQPGTTVVIHSTGYNEVPVVATCNHCHQVVTSRVEYVTGSFTWMMCCIIFIFCPLFCWLIPFCMMGMKDVYHYCPNCSYLMGVHSRS